MLVRPRATRPPQGLLAALLYAAIVALLATLHATSVAGGAATPALVLDPPSGPCDARPVARGSGFPAGAVVSLTSERTRPPGEKRSPAQHVAVAADGTFALPLLAIHGDCGAPFAPPGTEYTFTAVASGPGVPDGRDVIARAVFTHDPGAAGAPRCFVETGFCVRGRFLAYFRAHGLTFADPGVSERESLALFGYPISGEFDQRLEDGKTYRVQYFERARMEEHPENAAPYDVLLGQFGRRVLAGVPGAPVAPVADARHGRYFPETGHNVLDGAFLDFWQANGGLAVFGYPLSEEFEQVLEDGKRYKVQYFERVRLEIHPEQSGSPYEVQLGQFGRQILGPADDPGTP